MSVFSQFDKSVLEILGGRATKARAIAFSEARPKGFDGVAVVRRLFLSLDNEFWKVPSNRVTGNWQWRNRVPRTQTKSTEVLLERAICSLDGLTTWSFQMSTCSGLRGKHSDKRRAIDLVGDFGAGHFAFIELKVGSDNPLLAAFEILGYYLAYVRARANGYISSANHDVMQATQLDLVVAGPESWYEYSVRRGGTVRRYELDWLGGELTAGIQQLSLGLPKASLRFHSFPSRLDEHGQAAYIIDQFGAGSNEG